MLCIAIQVSDLHLVFWIYFVQIMVLGKLITRIRIILELIYHIPETALYSSYKNVDVDDYEVFQVVKM